MRHSFLDKYSDRDSPVHRLDPRTKFLAAVLLILALALVPPDSWLTYGLCFVLVAAAVLVARVPVGYVLKRSLVIMPFVAMIAVFIPFFKEGEVAGSYNVWLWQVTVTRSGLQVLVNILAKSWLSILALIWLTSTTRLTDLLQGLERLRLPRVLIMIMSFMYRYLFILVDEVERLKQARDSRSFGGGRLWHLKTIGHMMGTLFIRSYERGERVYAAMVARGFDGQSRTFHQLHFRPNDAVFMFSVTAVLAVAAILPFLI